MYKAAIPKWLAQLKKIQFLLTPLLIGLFPVLSLYARNIQDVLPNLVTQPLLIVVGVTLSSGLILRSFIKSAEKVGIVLSMGWLFFFLYVPLMDLIGKYYESIINLDSLLLPMWTLFFLMSALFISKSKKSLSTVLNFFTVMGVVVVTMQIYGILNFTIQPKDNDLFKYLANNEDKSLQSRNSGSLPDIYYILLDGYPRSDTLKEYFGYDNGEFDDYLTKSNFFIASKSHTNYSQTALAIPAILNMSYIEDLVEQGGITLSELMELYHNNKTLQYLKNAGYKWINNTNYYRAGSNPFADLNILCNESNEFLKELANTTMIKPVALVADQQRQDLRSDGLCVIDNFDTNLPGPQFTFSHIISPHPPYVYGANGEDVSEVNLGLNNANRWLAKEPFLEQLKYLNRRVKEKVESILSTNPESIIIIQSDHGTLSSATEATNLADTRPIVLRERSRNYLAIHLPGYCNTNELYDSLTGVNTIRSILNACFDANFPRIDDLMYYNSSGPGGYSHFRDITDIVRD